MDCKGTTASALALRNRRLSEPQKLPKRVSFKDETWVVHIPARDDSTMDLRESVIFTRNAVARNSSLTNRTLALKTNTRPSLETLSRTSSYANRGQTSTQTLMTSTTNSSEPGCVLNRSPYKSILKTPTPRNQQNEADRLKTSHLPARYVGEASRHSLNNYFKHDSSHLLPSQDCVNRAEKPGLTRTLSSRRTLPISRSLGSDDTLLFNKTGRFVRKEFSAGSNRTSLDYNLNHSERTNKVNSSAQPGVNFDIVGVTCGSVSEMPYFYDIRGIVHNGMNEYSSETKSPLHDRTRSEHSSVSTPLRRFSSKSEQRYLSAIPAIEAFNRRNRGTRRYSSSDWTRKQDVSPKRQLPIAWQPAKQYNFSTK